MREDTQHQQQEAVESQENLILRSSHSEMFDFEETSGKSSNPSKVEDQNPDEINYDVDPTLQEEITHEDTETSAATATSNNNSDFPTMISSIANQEKNGDPEDSDEDEDEDDEDNMVINCLLWFFNLMFLRVNFLSRLM